MAIAHQRAPLSAHYAAEESDQGGQGASRRTFALRGVDRSPGEPIGATPNQGNLSDPPQRLSRLRSLAYPRRSLS
jgi:hypothetical protein